MNQMQQLLQFKTNVLLKDIIGKDLINNDNIAILELVKNSFDAHAPRVKVSFLNLVDNDDTIGVPSEHSSKIIIDDNGSGMTMDDIKDKWLNIAYSEKKEQKKQSDEIIAGAKGVGRFSCDRLGRFLDLYSRRAGEDVIHHLQVDWAKFEIDGQKDLTIQAIPLLYEEVFEEEVMKKFGTKLAEGTILEISLLRSNWLLYDATQKVKFDAGKIVNLRKYLEKLINPNSAFENRAFTINLMVPELTDYISANPTFPKVNGVIENKIFQSLEFSTTMIVSEISKDGTEITTTLTDKGNRIFEIKEKNFDYTGLRDTKIVIYYLNPYAKAFFKRKTGVRAIGFGSIFLFIDGFRVNPLGDEGNDWLGLEIRKGQGHARFLGAREVVGRIEINDTHHKIRIVSSREGIVMDDLSRKLVNPIDCSGFYYKTHKRLERYVVKGLKWDKTTAKSIEIEKTVDRDGIIEEKYVLPLDEKINNIVSNAVPIITQDTKPENIISVYFNEDLFRKINEDGYLQKREKLDRFIKRNDIVVIPEEVHERTVIELQQAKENLRKAEQDRLQAEREIEHERQKNLYLLATRSRPSKEAQALIHSISITSKAIDGQLKALTRLLTVDKFSKKDALKRINRIRVNSEKNLLLSKIVTRAGFRTQAASQRINISKFIIEYFNTLRDSEEYSLQYIINYNGIVPLFITASVLELGIIFDNLVSNAAKAAAHTIQLDFSSTAANELFLLFSDDGNGIPDEFCDNLERIFELGITSTDGSGIGLYCIRDLLAKVKIGTASISCLGNGVKLRGASFQLLFKGNTNE